MEITLVCAVVACLRVFPSRSQFFQYESLNVTCEGNISEDWKVRRNTSKQQNEICPFDSTEINEFPCFFGEIYETDSGVYWCESAAGERSNEVNISVTNGDLILDSPEHPVNEGENLNLKCKVRSSSLYNLTYFYKNNVLIGMSSTGDFLIQGVSKSNEGLYKCNVSAVGESPESWLAVRGRSPQTPTAPLAHILLPVAACILLMILLMLLCRWRNHKGRGINRAVSYTEVIISQERKPHRVTDLGAVQTFYSRVRLENS